MTTIAATETMVAADTRVNVGARCYYAGKIYVLDGTIIACGGDNAAIKRFLEWWQCEERGALRFRERWQFEAVVLNHDGLFVIDTDGVLDRITDGVIAVGSGKELAMASLDTMKALGRKPDPRVAVAVAAKRDSNTGGQIQSVRLSRKRP